MNTFRTFLAAAAAMAALPAFSATITVRPDLDHPGRTIPADFAGLSFESRMLLPDQQGEHFFRGDHDSLVEAFHLLDIRSLRIGGNTAERPTVDIPGRDDINPLFAFARRARVRVLYTLRLDGSTPEAAVATARFINLFHGGLLDCFVIGNEPNKTTFQDWHKDYGEWHARWLEFAKAIQAPSAVPDSRFAAPTTTDGNPDWAAKLAADEDGTGRLQMIAQHYYPGHSSRQWQGKQDEAREALLELDWHGRYKEFADRFVPEVLKHGQPYRMEETNSFSLGGVHGASDSFAAALWGIDYLYWWASEGAAGINFHCGIKAYPGDDVIKKNVYTALTPDGKGVNIQPLGYGIKVFQIAGPDRKLLQTQVGDAPKGFQAWSTLDLDGTVYVTLLNGNHGSDAEPLQVAVTLPHDVARASTMALRVAGNDPSTLDGKGVTLGGEPFDSNAHWTGQWETLPTDATQGGTTTVSVPPASALIVRLRK